MQEYQGLKQLYLENYSSLICFAKSVMTNKDAAEDLVQETFLIAQCKLDAVLSSPNPHGWLMNTLKNLIGNYYKQQRFIAQHLIADSYPDSTSEYTFSVNELYAGLVSPEELELLVWVYCENVSRQEAAERLGISPAACRKRIQRAKSALRDAIQKNNLL